MKQTECWIYAGTTDRNGYPQLSHNKSTVMIHRVMYENYVGSIEPNLHLDHLCGNRTCINPEHLEMVSADENNKRSNTISTINKQKTHCSNGHLFSPENTYLYKDKWRQCRLCTTIRLRKAYIAKKEKVTS